MAAAAAWASYKADPNAFIKANADSDAKDDEEVPGEGFQDAVGATSVDDCDNKFDDELELSVDFEHLDDLVASVDVGAASLSSTVPPRNLSCHSHKKLDTLP